MILRSTFNKGISPPNLARFFSSTTSQLATPPTRFTPNPDRLSNADEIGENLQFITGLVGESNTKRVLANKSSQTSAKLRSLNRAKDLEMFQNRQWKEGDVYSPHDLSWEEMQKWKKPKKVAVDAFDTLGINPLHEYKVS